MISYRAWYVHGQRHRIDGPAVEMSHPDGAIKETTWYLHDKCHREDGPALEYFSKDKYHRKSLYYLDDTQLSEPVYRRRVILLKLSKNVGIEGVVIL